jgi:UDP-N-acetylglucosamine 4,6-dehydratase/5-epimerase
VLTATRRKTVVVTGGCGFLGRQIVGALARAGVRVAVQDLPDGCVLDSPLPDGDACIHLAAHKHAPLGEEIPAEVADLNVRGTARVVERYGGEVVLASTCKAADPMTVYGASKLIAERIVLNAGGRVVRLVNVVGSSGSVAEIWGQIPGDEPLPVTDCMRMWITDDYAAGMLLAALSWPSGRYGPDVQVHSVADLAEYLYPGRETREVPLRRGDREFERLVGEYETSESWRPGVVRILHPAD